MQFRVIDCKSMDVNVDQDSAYPLPEPDSDTCVQISSALRQAPTPVAPKVKPMHDYKKAAMVAGGALVVIYLMTRR